MKIILRPLGTLQHYFGNSRIEVACSPGITFFQLCEVIDRRWGSLLPSGLWNANTRRFMPQVMVMLGDKELGRQDDPVLNEGQEVLLLVPFSGG